MFVITFFLGKVQKLAKRSKERKKVRKLTSEQSILLKKLFQARIASRKELNREECDAVIHKYPVIKDLHWTKIKNTIHNWITLQKQKVRNSCN